VLDVNVGGVVHGVRAFLPHLLAGGRGHIVNTASMAGLAPGVGAPYDASKHAVVALSEDLYLDLQARLAPVGVSCLCPGWVRTDIVDADRNWPADHGAVPERAVTTGAIEHHLRRAIAEGMTPAEVADRVATAIAEDRFWVLPDPEWLEIAADRWDSIRTGANPSRPEQMPGLPPTSRLFEEIIASVLGERDTPAG
jgi:NAD(P)-dependent dehydrogenase (short-subunit alcohol dehydrogenase family)